jgi:protein-S-isoprenylcysteine O-methyltransferase Ste14
MFGILLATGAAKTGWPLFVAGVVFFIVETESRIRAEDRLLASRFADEFSAYARATKAFSPFIR